MSRVREREQSGIRIDVPGEHRHEHAGFKIVIKLAIEIGQQFRRTCQIFRERTHLHADARHVQRARNRLAGNVGDDESLPAIAELEEIVVIAADDARCGVAVGEAVAGNLRSGLRKKALLDAARQREIVRLHRALGRLALRARQQPRELAGDADEHFLIARAPRIFDQRAFQIQNPEHVVAEPQRDAGERGGHDVGAQSRRDRFARLRHR